MPVHFRNHEASPGLKRGGALNVDLHEVELLAPADAIYAALRNAQAGLKRRARLSGEAESGSDSGSDGEADIVE